MNWSVRELLSKRSHLQLSLGDIFESFPGTPEGVTVSRYCFHGNGDRSILDVEADFTNKNTFCTT